MAGTTHYLKLSDSQAEMVRNGKKRVDARPIAGIYAPIRVGDHIHYDGETEVTVSKINTYGSMKELLDHEGWESIVPDASGPEEAYRKVTADLASGEERFPAKAIYFTSMEGHWFKYWFRKTGKEQV